MTDVKRVFEESTVAGDSQVSDLDSLPPLKKSKKPLNKLSPFGQLLTQNDIIYYQKEAIFRLLNHERKKANLIVKDYNLLNSNFNQLLNCFNILNNWYDQLITNLSNGNANDNGSVTNNDNLLIKFDITNPENESESSIDIDSLSSKREKLINLISSITPSSTLNNDQLLDLQNNITSSNVLIDNLKVENSLLKSKIDDLNLELDDLIRANDKADSKSLQRIGDKNKLKQEQDGGEQGVKNGNSSGNVLPNGIKQEQQDNINNDTSTHSDINDNTNTNGSTSTSLKENEIIINKYELDDLNNQLKDYKFKNSQLVEEINKQNVSLTNFKNEILILTNKLSNLNENDLIELNLDFYKELINSKEKLNKELALEKEKVNELNSKFTKFDSQFIDHELKLNDTLKKELSLNNQHIAKIETDLVRIRTDRDELNSKLSIMKTEKNKNELNDEFIKVTDLLNKRISDLEEKFNKEFLDIDESSSSLDIQTLLRHNKTLSIELKQVEEAFQQSRNLLSNKAVKLIDNDNLINKLNIEKSKADQKYFAAMRSKDSLNSQNKILELNIKKLTELNEIANLNESKLLKKLANYETNFFKNLEKLENFYNKDLNFQINKNKELDFNLKNLSSSKKSLEIENQKSKETLDLKTKELNNLQMDYSSLQNKLKILEKQLIKYKTTSNNSNISSSNSDEDDEVKRGLLFMTKCQLCNKDFKDVTLKTCGHCFCKNCINDRLNSRMRKCPNCNKQFSNYDLLEIHL